LREIFRLIVHPTFTQEVNMRIRQHHSGLALSVLAFVLLNAVFVQVAAFNDPRSAPAVWQVAPPAPAITEAEWRAEFAARRNEVMKRIGERGILVLFSAEPRLYANDVDYPFRQENNLYYLTGIRQAGATLVIIPGAKQTREILFMPRPNPARETWTGHMLTADETRTRSGIQTVLDSDQFNGFLAWLAPRAAMALRQRGNSDAKRPAQWDEDFKSVREAVSKDEAQLWLLLPSFNPESREYNQEQKFASQLAAVASGLSIRSAMPIFAELRQTKSPLEVKLMQQAVDISIEGFNRAYAVAAPGVYEYEVRAEFEYTYRRRNADNWGYPCIVGGGANATTLHYETSQDALPVGGLLLMDCAAEFDHYSADITRTMPLSGKFTKEQADIYRIVYEAQMEAIKLARVGKTKDDVHNRAAEVIREGLLRLGLITSKENNEFRTWFMHGTSHWLGMNVHDVGVTSKLAPGMIFTVEPGIYIRPDALDVLPRTPENEKFIAAVRPGFEKYKGIGVRIEDDVLVTDGEPKVMSAALPSKLEEVEAQIQRIKQEAQKAGMP
jgi:Xaa-Pro aminopeptidase